MNRDAKTLTEAFGANYHLINPAKRPTGTGLHPQGWEVPSRGSLLVPPSQHHPPAGLGPHQQMLFPKPKITVLTTKNGFGGRVEAGNDVLAPAGSGGRVAAQGWVWS